MNPAHMHAFFTCLLIGPRCLLQLDLANNQLCGLGWQGRGTYTAEGITAIADALRVNASLTSVR